MYHQSINIPMILVPTLDSGLKSNDVDERIVELKDVLPTLMELAGVEIPYHVEGISMVSEDNKWEYSYGQLWDDDRAHV